MNLAALQFVTYAIWDHIKKVEEFCFLTFKSGREVSPAPVSPPKMLLMPEQVAVGHCIRPFPTIQIPIMGWELTA